MRVLLFMSHAGYARNFQWTISGLLERGHVVHVALDKSKDAELSGLLKQMTQDNARLTVGPAPSVNDWEWSGLAKAMRVWIDYLRYLTPAFADAPKLRARGVRRIPPALARAMDRVARSSPRAIDAFRRACQRCHEGFPTSRELRDFVREWNPDVVVITPLLEIASPQPEYIRVSRRLGIPVCVPVASWDNLTTKGLIQEAPDVVTVWNEAQRDELELLHGIDPRLAVVTGAVAYDHWFDWQPSRERALWCRSVGLDPDRPFLLYVCSSPFIAPNEAEVALRWIEGIRSAAGGPLADVQVLVRPHPQNPMDGPARAVLEDLQDVIVHPPQGANPMDTPTREDYFDSIFNCHGVLGVNTSALLEASIVDRPVHTLLEPAYADTQLGTLHFRHLLPENGGMLHVANDVEELVQQLGAALEGTEEESDRNREFVKRFIRPHGLEDPASPRLVAVIESLSDRVPHPVSGLSRAFGLPLAVLMRVSMSAYGISRRLAKAYRRAVRAVRSKLRLSSPRTRRAQTSGLMRRIGPLSDSTRPVIAGPFLGEVGFELLYWIPFLRWVTGQFPALRERLIVVSRGGTREWYGDLAHEYVDAFELCSPDELAQGRSTLKHLGEPSAFDRRLLSGAQAHLDLENVGSLHPILMWEAYRANIRSDPWAYQRSVRQHRVEAKGLNSVYRPFERPLGPAVEAALPSGPFAAVRFYFRPSFPASPDNQRLAQTVIREISKELPVVLLNNRLEVDEHRDLDFDAERGISTLHALMTPETNLLVQSIAISRAAAFVGTYGGLSYLAPHYGVPSLGLIDDATKVHSWHFGLAARVFSGLGWGSIATADTGTAASEIAGRVRALAKGETGR